MSFQERFCPGRSVLYFSTFLRIPKAVTYTAYIMACFTANIMTCFPANIITCFTTYTTLSNIQNDHFTSAVGSRCVWFPNG